MRLEYLKIICISLIFFIGIFALRLLNCWGVICYGYGQGVFTHLFLPETIISGSIFLSLFGIDYLTKDFIKKREEFKKRR